MTRHSHRLLQAIQMVTDASPSSLTEAYSRLSERYRNEEETNPQISATDVSAYGIARLPATLASVTYVLSDLHNILPDWNPLTAVDIGAGPGTAGWAAALQFGSLQQLTFIERAEEMAQLGRRVAQLSDTTVISNAHWEVGPEATVAKRADLVLACYLLGELPAATREAAIARWWNLADGCLVIVEPGTPRAAERLQQARLQLTALGAKVIAPCLSGTGCATSGGWCHFAAHVERSAQHRATKGGTLSYEDEKFSYLVASSMGADTSAIVIQDPAKRSGHVRMQLCDHHGALTTVVSKRDGDAYRWARNAGWGTRMPSPD